MNYIVRCLECRREWQVHLDDTTDTIRQLTQQACAACDSYESVPIAVVFPLDDTRAATNIADGQEFLDLIQTVRGLAESWSMLRDSNKADIILRILDLIEFVWLNRHAGTGWGQ
jgi:hypothetical protein